MDTAFTLRPAAEHDLPAIVGLIRELAEFEKLSHLVVVTPQSLQPHLFGPKPAAQAVVAEKTLQGRPTVVGCGRLAKEGVQRCPIRQMLPPCWCSA